MKAGLSTKAKDTNANDTGWCIHLTRTHQAPEACGMEKVSASERDSIYNSCHMNSEAEKHLNGLRISMPFSFPCHSYAWAPQWLTLTYKYASPTHLSIHLLELFARYKETHVMLRPLDSLLVFANRTDRDAFTIIPTPQPQIAVLPAFPTSQALKPRQAHSPLTSPMAPLRPLPNQNQSLSPLLWTLWAEVTSW